MQGLDIIQDIPVLPWEAVLGTTATVQSLDGTKLSVKIPPGVLQEKN